MTKTRREKWISDNGIWKVFGLSTVMNGIRKTEVRVMKLKNGRYEFYYGKNVPVYVTKISNQMYEELGRM